MVEEVIQIISEIDS
jgi:hypothetical protein